MARKARPNSRTILRYVTPEDSAIGLEPDQPGEGLPKEFSDGWKAYNETFDESHLKLKVDETTSYYYIKPLTLDAQTKFFEAFSDAGEGVSMFEKAFSPGMKHVLRDFVERFVVGCDFHEEVESVGGHGEFLTKSFAWEVGLPRPEGLVDSILADANLTFNLFMFAINSSKLSEKEKKP